VVTYQKVVSFEKRRGGIIAENAVEKWSNNGDLELVAMNQGRAVQALFQ
jgi:hypothetical protein